MLVLRSDRIIIRQLASFSQASGNCLAVLTDIPASKSENKRSEMDTERDRERLLALCVAKAECNQDDEDSDWTRRAGGIIIGAVSPRRRRVFLIWSENLHAAPIITLRPVPSSSSSSSSLERESNEANE